MPRRRVRAKARRRSAPYPGVRGLLDLLIGTWTEGDPSSEWQTRGQLEATWFAHRERILGELGTFPGVAEGECPWAIKVFECRAGETGKSACRRLGLHTQE